MPRCRVSALDTVRTRLPRLAGARLVAIVLLALTALPFTTPCPTCDVAVLFGPAPGAGVHRDRGGPEPTRVATEATLAAPDQAAAIGEDRSIGDLAPAVPVHHACVSASIAADPSDDPLTPIRPGRSVLLPLRL